MLDPLTRRQYPTAPASVAQVRRQCRDFLDGMGLSAANNSVSDVILIVSELASNAINYGASGLPFYFSIALYGDIVHVSVRDHVDMAEGATLKANTAGEDDEHGRGLFLVEALADTWGTREETLGKTVWAEKRITPCTD